MAKRRASLLTACTMTGNNITTMSTNIPNPETVLAELSEFLRIAVEGLDAGTTHARQYYEARNRPVEGPLASMLTRSVAKEYITERCRLTVEEFEQKEVGNLGLRAAVLKYDVWIWKSPDNNIPYPGDSDLKRRFLSQRQLAFGLPEFFIRAFNLVLLWNADHKYRLADAYLALPKSAPDRPFGPTDVYWCERVPHPALLVAPVNSAQRGPLPEPVRFERRDTEEQARSVEQER